MFFLDTNKEELEMSKELEYKIKVLLAWKELAEEAGNEWAAKIASKHIISLQRMFYGT
jgi:hypothetical protein